MVQKGFQSDRFRYLVAISDKGVINQQGSSPPELVKADAVTTEIDNFLELQNRFTGSKAAVSFFAASNEEIAQRLPPWTVQELTSINQFLIASDCSTSGKSGPSAMPPLPRTPSNQRTPSIPNEPSDPRPLSTPSAPIVPAATVIPQKQETPATRSEQSKKSEKVCKVCGSSALEIKYGKYGYYFKCLSCDGNTPVDSTCPACNQKAKLRKAKKQFFWNCSCGIDAIYFENQ